MIYIILAILVIFYIGLLNGLYRQKKERIKRAREKCRDCRYCSCLLNSGFTYCLHPKNEKFMSSTMIMFCKFKEAE